MLYSVPACSRVERLRRASRSIHLGVDPEPIQPDPRADRATRIRLRSQTLKSHRRFFCALAPRAVNINSYKRVF